MTQNKDLKVRCPRCLKEFNYYLSEFRPFCCERCKMVDFGNWLLGKYTVPGEKAEDTLESSPESAENETDEENEAE
ncbi:MAG: DNA gyrase inhibitor YacG [Pseudomonadota bacterium]